MLPFLADCVQNLIVSWTSLSLTENPNQQEGPYRLLPGMGSEQLTQFAFSTVPDSHGWLTQVKAEVSDPKMFSMLDHAFYNSVLLL